MLLKNKGYRVISVPPDTLVLAAVKEMNDHGIGCIMVMDGPKLVGVFTERDVLTRVVAAEVNPATCSIKDVMTRNPLTITENGTIQQTMDLFHGKNCRHLPVLDRSGRVVGMISIRDISRWLSDAHQAEAQQLRQYISGYPG